MHAESDQNAGNLPTFAISSSLVVYRFTLSPNSDCTMIIVISDTTGIQSTLPINISLYTPIHSSCTLACHLTCRYEPISATNSAPTGLIHVDWRLLIGTIVLC